MSVGVLGVLDSPLLGVTLDALHAEGIQISAVLIDHKNVEVGDAERWRERTGGKIAPVALSNFANEKIPFYFVGSHNGDVSAQLIQDLDLKLLVNGGTPRILKENILHSLKYGVLNVHPGKLPDYRGCTAPEWAIYNDEQIYNTVHYMVDEIDGGPIVLTEGYFFLDSDSYMDIRVDVYRKGYKLLAKGVKKVLEEALPMDRIAKQPRGGKYYKPISDRDLSQVKSIVRDGKYRFQKFV